MGIDMLLAPGVPEEVLLLYFHGLRECALTKVFPKAWQRVIYVLLVKPGKDSRLVRERRDIALMAQGMKLLGRMLLSTAFADMETRLAEEQLGWTKAVGACDGVRRRSCCSWGYNLLAGRDALSLSCTWT